jgi:hypothetical protein
MAHVPKRRCVTFSFSARANKALERVKHRGNGSRVRSEGALRIKVTTTRSPTRKPIKLISASKDIRAIKDALSTKNMHLQIFLKVHGGLLLMHLCYRFYAHIDYKCVSNNNTSCNYIYPLSIPYSYRG